MWCSFAIQDCAGAVGISPLVALQQKEEKGPQLLRTELAY